MRKQDSLNLPRSGQRAEKIPRIKKTRDFDRVLSGGTKVVCREFVLFGTTTRLGSLPLRVGFITSKRVGNAVTRNRARRRLKEIFRGLSLPWKEAKWDIVVVGRRNAAFASYDNLCRSLDSGFRRMEANFNRSQIWSSQNRE